MKKFLISLIVISLISQVPGFSMDSMLMTEIKAEENTEPENNETTSPIVYEEETENNQQENVTTVVETENETVTSQSGELPQEQIVQVGERVSVANVEAMQEVYPFALGETDLPLENTKVTISTLAGLIKLSHCDPETIKNITINIQVSGSISTIANSAYVEKEGTKYYFKGLGSTDCPFDGSFIGNAISITVNRAIFNGVTSNVNCNGNTLIWSNSEQTPKSIIAESYVFSNEDEQKFEKPLNLNVTIAENSVIPGALFGEVRGEKGTLKLQKQITYGSNMTVNNQQSTQNAGFVCNTLKIGKILIGSEFVFPESISVGSVDESAGGIIGKMENGTSLEFNSQIASVTVNKGTHSGGLVGYAVNADITGTGKLTTVSVKAKANSGGLVGYLEWSKDTELQIHGGMLAKSTVTLLSDNPTGMNAGGLYGTVKLGKGKRGSLTLTDTLVLNNDNSNQFATFGGLIGNLEGGETGVSIFEINANNNSISIINSNENVSIFGGIIGQVGSHTTVFAKNNYVSISSPKANVFGGLVGNIADTGILVLENENKISTSNDIATIEDEPAVGGLVGSISVGSVLSISGTTDLSEVVYAEGQYYGQLVGKQNNSLVFAKGSGNDEGWRYIRSSQKPKIDDIANYGQVIRLKSSVDAATGKLSPDLFNVNNEGLLVIKKYGSTEFAVGSVDDFALLAVLWQSEGSVKAENTPNYNNISSANISLSSDIDLTGTGIIGLMKDTTDNNPAFNGSFNGVNHAVTLSIGEAYGCFKNGETFTPAADTDAGCGRIYYHDALGLFAVINCNLSIFNVTINGKIDVETHADNCYVGGISGLVQGGTFQINNVTVSEYVLCGNVTSKPLYAGGVFGALNNTTTITYGSVNKPIVSKAVIKVSSTHDGKYMCLGGLIGAVLGANNQAELHMANVELSKLSDNSTNLDGTSITEGQSFFAGGLIGAIVPYASGKKKTINIKKVVVNGYKVATNNTSGDNSISGGLLGSLWINTDVIFGDANSTDNTYALQVVDGSNIADYVTYYGGLVYAASGKWTINSHGIDLSGAKLSAIAASSFGILVHDAYDGVTPILGTKINRGGLYIELTSQWEDAYRLEAEGQKITTSVKDEASFDEFAAYTAGSGSDDMWLSEKNGVISLHIDDSSNEGKLLMDGKNINSYVNRSYVGKTKKTNSHSRYYYNLDRLYAEVEKSVETNNNSRIDTNAELMLWSVCRYCATNLRNYFTGRDVSYDASQIGGSSDATVDFDLNGYSYYPIDILNVDLTVQNATFVFYNQEIENGENANNNKKTSAVTQHEGMHCGLFRNYLRQS